MLAKRSKNTFSVQRLSMAMLSISLLATSLTSLAAVPAITGSQTIVTPATLLEWPQDFPVGNPYLTEPTANRLNDLHGQISNCDIVLSTSGNYHMALKELWQVYLKDFAKDLDIKTWYYTTSPPISPVQVPNGTVQFGNMNANCVPQVAVGPGKVMNKLLALGVNDGNPIPVIKNQGNVILVKKGNPKHIKTVWDLGRADVTVVTPNPQMEAGSFGNFSGSIYNIAANDSNPPNDMTAEMLFNSIFNSTSMDKKHPKWVTGKRIMHREIPWAISADKADAGVIFYHLALYFKRTFPDKFDIVPLGGTVENPKPVTGNKIGVLKAVRIKGDWNRKQYEAREALIEAMTSEQFTPILKRHGINRP